MKRKKYNDYSDEQLKNFMRLSAKKKLRRMAELNGFLKKVTPEKSRRINERLKKEGF